MSKRKCKKTLPSERRKIGTRCMDKSCSSCFPCKCLEKFYISVQTTEIMLGRTESGLRGYNYELIWHTLHTPPVFSWPGLNLQRFSFSRSTFITCQCSPPIYCTPSGKYTQKNANWLTRHHSQHFP